MFTRYISPIESKRPHRIRAIEKPIAVSGCHLARPHRSRRLDFWRHGRRCGDPRQGVEDVLRKAEEVGGIEDLVRQEIRHGADVTAVFQKYGRL